MPQGLEFWGIRRRFARSDSRLTGRMSAETGSNRLFDPARDPGERVREDEWFYGGSAEFAALYTHDTVEDRRRWYRNLAALGMVERPSPR